jgi:hypothetical protein
VSRSIRICICEKPVDVMDPRLKGWCRRCMGKIESLTTDENVGRFFDRLAEALYRYDREPGKTTYLKTTAGWETFRQHCEARERAGRDTFGNRFMSRPNLQDAREEAADLALYMLLDSLREEIENGTDADIDMALTAALYAFRAYDATLQLAEKRNQGTGPGWDSGDEPPKAA